MKTNRLKIHCFDDEAVPASWVEIAICPYHSESAEDRQKWTNDNIAYKRFKSVGEAIAYYEKTNDYPDLIAIDIDSRELHQSYKLSDAQINLIPLNYRVDSEKTSTRGKDLMRYAIEKFPNSQMFYITGQIGNVGEVFDEVMNATIRGLTTIRRDKSEAFVGIQLPFLKELKQVARKYICKLDSYAKIGLKDKLCELNKEDFLDLKVNIDFKEYHLKDILVAYLPLEGNEFRLEINKLFPLDLSLAASECFGILGIKQITHKTRDYYYIDNRLFLKIKNQINSFNKIINEISDESIKDKLMFFKNNINEFSTIFKENNDQIFNQKLREKRNLNFQFKGDRFDEILGQDKNVPTDNSNFELNIPIQEIFNTEFKIFIESILEKSGKGAWANTYNWFNLATTESSENVEGFEIKLWNNFIGFYHDGKNIFDPENTNHYRADWLKSFQKSLDCFGKLYILKKDGDNEYSVFDCTYDSVIKIGEYSKWKCRLKDHSKMKDVVNLQKDNYFLFSFLTKKPKY